MSENLGSLWYNVNLWSCSLLYSELHMSALKGTSQRYHIHQLFRPYINNEGVDQHAHPFKLIGFIVCCLPCNLTKAFIVCCLPCCLTKAFYCLLPSVQPDQNICYVLPKCCLTKVFLVCCLQCCLTKALLVCCLLYCLTKALLVCCLQCRLIRYFIVCCLDIQLVL